MKFDIFNVSREARQKALEDAANGNSISDELFFPKAKDGKDNVYKATIRLLPNPLARTKEEVMFIKKYRHYLSSNEFGLKGYYDSPSTKLGFDCPIGKEFYKLYKKGEDGDGVAKTKAKKLKREQVYYAYCIVIDDKVNPDNNGKIKIFQFGYKIHDKLQNVIKGDPDSGILLPDPYDLINGCDLYLNLTVNVVNGVAQNSYDKCMFKPNANPVKYNGVYINSSDEAYAKFKEDFVGEWDGETEVVKAKARPDILKYDYKEQDKETLEKMIAFAKSLTGSKTVTDNLSGQGQNLFKQQTPQNFDEPTDNGSDDDEDIDFESLMDSLK